MPVVRSERRAETEHSVVALCRQKPPSLPANTPGKRAADAFLRIGDAYRGWALVAVIVALFIVSGFLPRRGELAVDLVAFALGSGYCLANFWRCREPHCVISGAGWSALTAFTAVELALGRSLVRGYEQLIFLGVLVLAGIFEAIWRYTTGSNELRRSSPSDRDPDQHICDPAR